jgi:hypothetical protein
MASVRIESATKDGGGETGAVDASVFGAVSFQGFPVGIWRTGRVKVSRVGHCRAGGALLVVFGFRGVVPLICQRSRSVVDRVIHGFCEQFWIRSGRQRIILGGNEV